MKRSIFFVALIAMFAVVSCSKDQRAVNKLEGTWEDYMQDGVEVPDSSKGTTVFTKCKLKKDEWCDMTYTEADGTVQNSLYKVSDDGTVLTQKIEDPEFGAFEFPVTILELTKENLVMEVVFFDTSTVELRKVD